MADRPPPWAEAFESAVSAPFRMQPGLRRLDGSARHLTPVGPGDAHQREKLAVLSCFASQALCRRDGFDPLPALQAVAQRAAREHPQVFAWDGRTGRALGVAVRAEAVVREASGVFGTGDEIGRCLDGLATTGTDRLAGLLALAFQEDLAIVDGRDGRIPWLCVTLPSFWAPEEKIGRVFADIHAPVADNRLILAAAERLVALVTAGEPWERHVWTITGHPRLHAHPQRVDPQRWPDTDDPDALAAAAWWRCERQTFIPVPGLPQAVFTIRVGRWPLRAVAADPARARRLAETLSTMSPAVLAYRGLDRVAPALLHWLQRRSQPPGDARGSSLGHGDGITA